MQNITIEAIEDGQFIAYYQGDYHIGYGYSADEARASLRWSMENE